MALAERLDAAAGREEAWSEDQVGGMDEIRTRYGRDTDEIRDEIGAVRRGLVAERVRVAAAPRHWKVLHLVRHYYYHLGVPVSHVAGPSLRTSRPPGSQGSASRPEFFLQNSGGPGGIQEHGPMRVLRKYI